MTLDGLRAELAKLDHLPGSTIVILAKDCEGNDYSPLASIGTAMYDADSTYSGDLYLTDEDRDAMEEPDEYDEAPESAVPAVFLWPTN